MDVLHFTTRVPATRQMTLTLPPDTPVGDEVEVVVRQPTTVTMMPDVVLSPDNGPKVFPSRPTHPKLAAEHDAFQQLLPDLLATLRDKYVAVHDGVVVAVADTEIEALNRAVASAPGTIPLVRLVTDQPQPIPRSPGFRVVRASQE